MFSGGTSRITMNTSTAATCQFEGRTSCHQMYMSPNVMPYEDIYIYIFYIYIYILYIYIYTYVELQYVDTYFHSHDMYT